LEALDFDRQAAQEAAGLVAPEAAQVTREQGWPVARELVGQALLEVVRPVARTAAEPVAWDFATVKARDSDRLEVRRVWLKV